MTAPGPAGGTVSGTMLRPHRGQRWEALDGYRALAALGVLVFHVAANPTSFAANDGSLLGAVTGDLGNLGVAVFFVLSAFLLYRPFVVAHLEGTPAPATLRFYRHRALRVVPAYWVALTAWFLLVWSGLAVRMPLTPLNLATVYGFAQVYRPGFAFAGLPLAWTLCIEVSFYLVLPGLAWLIARGLGARARSRRDRVGVQLLGVGAVVALGWIYRLVVVGATAVAPVAGPDDAQHLWLPNYLDWFGLGMAMAVAVAWRDTGGRLPRWFATLSRAGWLCWAAGAALVLVLAVQRQAIAEVAFGFSRETLGQLSLRMGLNGLAAALFLLPVAVGADRRGWIERSLSTAVPAYLGTISYGIFLWQLVWLQWLLRVGVRWSFWPMLAGVGALTVLTATVSWIAVERPLLRYKDARPGGVTLASRAAP